MGISGVEHRVLARLRGRAATWTGTVLILALIADLGIQVVMPKNYGPVALPHKLHLVPHSHTYGPVDLCLVEQGRQEPMAARTLGIGLADTMDEIPSGVRVDLRTLRYAPAGKTATSQTVNWSPLDQEAVLSWMRTAGIDAASTTARAEAQELLNLIKALASGTDLHNACDRLRHFDHERIYEWRIGRPPRWFGHVEMTSWGLVWLLGTVYLVSKKGNRGQSRMA